MTGVALADLIRQIPTGLTAFTQMEDGRPGAVVVVTTASPTVARTALVLFGRVMFITIDPGAWDSTLPRVGSSTEAAGREIQIRLGALEDLASVWSRAITTLMSTSGQR